MDKKKLTVYKANKLIEASYSAISLCEQTILLACIASQDPRTLTAETPVYLTVSAFSDLADINALYAYDDMKRAIKRLLRRIVTIHAPDPDDPALEETETHWVASADYYPSEGRIRLYFAARILPYLAQLQGQFTKYKLQHVLQFKSVYGVRLYELLVQWQSKGEREVDVEWLREKWGLVGQYKAMCDFKKRVMEPAIRDVNTYSNLWVKMGQRKVGRRIVAFQFRFGLKSTADARAKLDTGEAIPKRLTRRYIDQHARPGESYDAAYARLRRERDEQRRGATAGDQKSSKRRRGRRNAEDLRRMRAQLAEVE